MHGFRIVLPGFLGGGLDVERFLGSLRELSKEAKPPFSELQPNSAFVVGSGPKSALLRLRRVTLVLVLSVHRWLQSGGLAPMWACPTLRPAGADSAQAPAISNARTGVSGGAYCSLFKTGHLKNQMAPFILSGDAKDTVRS
jgi:hypothetical protein